MLYKKFQYNLDHLLGNRSTYPDSLAIAVSGGADSVALLMLLSIWASKNETKIFVMSIDHNLRLESKLENEYVEILSRNLGHKYLKFDWKSDDNLANLQERAREGRYKLLTDSCLSLGILTLLTAHHLDDYIENFCIRSERQSGIFGLSRSHIHFYNNIRILRPLYNIEKEELVNYLIENDIKWFEDKSNSSDKYHRNRIRKNLSKESGAFKQIIIASLHAIDEKVEDVLKPQLIEAIANSVSTSQLGFTKINLSGFAIYSKDIKLQLLSFVLITISGNNKLPRSKSIELIIQLIESGIEFAKTLHGCIIKKIKSNLLIYREFGKKSPNDVMLNKDVKWDNRFRFKSNINLPNIYITKFTMKDYIDIKDKIDLKELSKLTMNHHMEILFTLPVVKILEKVLVIPHISYYNNLDLKDKLNVSFEPSFTSRFLHFC